MDVLNFERKFCRCTKDNKRPGSGHINFLNLYLVEFDLHAEDHNDLRLWKLAQQATPFMTGWKELNVIVDEDSANSNLGRIGHWWRVGECPIATLRLKDLSVYGSGEQVCCILLCLTSKSNILSIGS